jgi:hypothetical protein
MMKVCKGNVRNVRSQKINRMSKETFELGERQRNAKVDITRLKSRERGQTLNNARKAPPSIDGCQRTAAKFRAEREDAHPGSNWHAGSLAT